ncbi:hypothetical protein [Roseixanthobacter glucoisosaccharinicivorans]|uniref:hypothetical protein n=1 Tax=Roseixanthobacter glucoisosaccharinicivorans TaxID=3119923 RepID=UPI00372683C7
MAITLAGCAGNSQGTFGAPGVNVDPAAAAGGVGAAQTTNNMTVGTGPDAVEFECPRVDVRSGASTWQVPAPGGGLKYQGSLGQMARECNIANGVMNVKVGLDGRVLLGDKGTPGALNVPIRIAVVQEGPSPKTITTKFFVVPLNIPQGETQTTFTVVEDTISFPVTTPEAIGKYVIYVGFDPKGETPARPRPARPRPAAPAADAAPAATAAPAAAKPAASKPAAPAAPAADPNTFGPAPTFGPPPATFGPPPAQ